MPNSENSQGENSMLDALLKSSGSNSGASPVSPSTAPSSLESLLQASPAGGGVNPNQKKPEKPKKPPMKPADFLKIVGAIFVVSMIFFGSFLAYIVFHPGEAQFFRTFNIEPARIADILRILVNSIF